MDMREGLPALGLAGVVAFSGYMVVQLHGQSTPPTGDFTNAAVAEVRDSGGIVILRGNFQLSDEEDDDIERKAMLEAVGSNTRASGEAEVEYTKATPVEQEVEFSVANLEPGASVTFVIDGREVATAAADDRGRAEVDLDVPVNGS